MRQVIRKSITDKWLLVDRASQRIKMDQIPYRLGNHASKQKKSSSSFLRCAVVQCTGCPNKCGLYYWSIPLTKFPKFSQSVSHFHGYLWEYQCKINKAMCATFKGIGNVKEGCWPMASKTVLGSSTRCVGGIGWFLVWDPLVDWGSLGWNVEADWPLKGGATVLAQRVFWAPLPHP